ncbi:DUF4129 domain-containing protein [Candidatus Bathyarchaeota archaeon]|nr:MAG: DUF4129 domain-containing protein [Candidatus Bathyarchaeota archaeon]
MAISTGAPRRQLVFRRYIYFIVALLALSVALGSLSRSEPGGSWLANSYWVLYIVMLLPIIALGAMIVMVVFLALTLRDTSDALGSGMARKARGKKRSKTIHNIIFMGTWAIALAVLWFKCGGIPCRSPPVPSQLQQLVFVNQNATANPAAHALATLLSASVSISGIVQSEWFFFAFFGLIIVSSVVMLRSAKVALDEFRENTGAIVLAAQAQGLRAVKDAIQIVQESDHGGPRERILLCYNSMIRAVSEMGASITVDQTARELERTIKRTFMINGDGIRTLTNLFEEARYSLHPMTEEDSQEAHASLMKIETELNVNS